MASAKGNYRKGGKKHWLEPGKSVPLHNMRGVLVSSDRADFSKKELYNLFNEYADKMFPKASESIPESDSIADSLDAEIAALKAESKVHRFQRHDGGCKGLYFMAFQDEKIEPVSFVKHILTDLHQTQQPKTRYTHRMVPIQRTCAVNIKEIEQHLKELLTPVFGDLRAMPKSYAIHFKARNNDTVLKQEVYDAVGDNINRSFHRVSLSNPEWVIIVEISKKTCFICVTDEYERYQRFNVRKMSGTEPERTVKQPKPRVAASSSESVAAAPAAVAASDDASAVPSASEPTSAPAAAASSPDTDAATPTSDATASAPTDDTDAAPDAKRRKLDEAPAPVQQSAAAAEPEPMTEATSSAPG
eukprot:TRINITY_DN22704_c0_g1_i1.p1 TRINITY_DN22704_c0_g1~~TRINITY_DN22704_c0_g1_i1.p1  ORF type:complete len:396 (-),score=91.69 TRINITY_DN22704_c0_g1_i1:272-1348(-)